MKIRELILDIQLRESKEVHTVTPRPINNLELRLVKEAQAFCHLIYEYLFGSKSDIKLTAEHLQELVDSLKMFKTYKFTERLIKSMEDSLVAHGKMASSKENISKNRHHFKKHSNDILELITSGDLDGAHSIAQGLNTLIDEIDAHIDINSETKSNLKTHFISEPSFFGTTRFLATLGRVEYEKILDIDTDSQLYTFLNFPKAQLDRDIDYLVYFMLNLKDSPKPMRINSRHDFRQYVKAANASDEDFAKLAKLIDEYLHSNNKKLIPEIVELVNQNPILRAANERSKKKIKVVYRGLGFRGEELDFSSDDVIEQDKIQKFVATSESRHAAKNFALSKGHLDAERNSKFGYLITYEVTPDAIILDTSVIETVYGEAEVLIDATRAKVKKVEEV